MEQWLQYQEKFLLLTKREKNIILFGGLFLILYLGFTFAIEPNIKKVQQESARIKDLKISINAAQASINIYQEALITDPNEAVSKEIEQQKALLSNIDEELLTLTSELINPVQMRIALVELLALQPGVSLSSFEVIAPSELFIANQAQDEANELNQAGENATGNDGNGPEDSAEQTAGNSDDTVALYRHGIKLTLTGRYSALQAYLAELEQLQWKFFWQEFDLKVTEYPNNELSVTLYSLSTAREFIGV
ncbi:hypothetical protein [Thalassotalea montiporae]